MLDLHSSNHGNTDQFACSHSGPISAAWEGAVPVRWPGYRTGSANLPGAKIS